MNSITPIELKQKLATDQNVILLDIREPYELEICSIGGLHIPMAEVANRVSEIGTGKEVVVLCRSGKRAIAVANLLAVELGMENISILEGGILAWAEQIDNTLETY
jgi:adenylyltransferase/sulfurtransferase